MIGREFLLPILHRIVGEWALKVASVCIQGCNMGHVWAGDLALAFVKRPVL